MTESKDMDEMNRLLKKYKVGFLDTPMLNKMAAKMAMSDYALYKLKDFIENT